MWFLFKGAFWFSLVLVSLPLLGPASDREQDARGDIAVAETFAALGTAVEDIRGICQRQPEVCVTGSQTLTALGFRARDGARIAYRYLDTALEEEGAIVDPAAETDQRATGTVAADTAPQTPDPTAREPDALYRAAMIAGLMLKERYSTDTPSSE